MTISSPVASNAIRGLRLTVSHGWFMAAASPMARASSRLPAATPTSPARKSRPAGANVAARRRACAHGNRVAVPARVLLNDDRIGAVRHRCAGENADRLAGADRALEAGAGGHAADLTQGDGRVHDIGGARGVTVHGRDGEGRLREAGDDVGCQHAAVSRGERHGLRRQRRKGGSDAGDRFSDRNHRSRRPELARLAALLVG